VSEDAERDDPVSWLLIRPGWKVVTADGSEVGAVDEVLGDDTVDIFDGLAVATSALGAPRYVPAERVGTITDGVVHLTITHEQAGQLGEFLEPATSAEIEPGGRGGIAGGVAADARELEGKMFAPLEEHEHPMNIWRRIALFVRRGLR
jgi:hypothetical protein